MLQMWRGGSFCYTFWLWLDAFHKQIYRLHVSSADDGSYSTVLNPMGNMKVGAPPIKGMNLAGRSI